MITNFFIPELNNHDVQELWFQQDGATCHIARATIDLLKETFGDRLISRFGPVNWPPRSCDLTPLDYFLWGYVKSLVYADKPQMLDHLEDNIRRVVADIRPQMLEKVIENWTSRLDYIRASRGSPMPEIIFKITLRFDEKTHLTIAESRRHNSTIGDQKGRRQLSQRFSKEPFAESTKQYKPDNNLQFGESSTNMIYVCFQPYQVDAPNDMRRSVRPSMLVLAHVIIPPRL
ncbi:putative transposable element [Trichonephila clavipes]|nr:putative transposable element [Trichonephila clavipes]